MEMIMFFHNHSSSLSSVTQAKMHCILETFDPILTPLVFFILFFWGFNGGEKSSCRWRWGSNTHQRRRMSFLIGITRCIMMMRMIQPRRGSWLAIGEGGRNRKGQMQWVGEEAKEICSIF
ncbi:unnamed protein product [Linum tenue]|uniref:Uncharacterized protein n=1 Tax=Linum tenue TaxID=586396 RepID=A0AAV0I6V8_9ROSI|nr:unnamed protein product [Linum tenue]